MPTPTPLPKVQEFRKVFETLPNVLIQDPVRGCAYYLPCEALEQFRTSPETWLHLDESTVAFTIPDGEEVDEVPPFLRDSGLKPSVHLRYSRGKTAYLIPFEALQGFRIDQPTKMTEDNNSISFILPRSMEMVEELPGLTRALLQAGTAF